MKRIIWFLSFLILSLSGYSQDSLVCFTPDEVRVLTKMSEDLRYTKQELSVCDSIMVHQDSVISLQDSIIFRKDLIIEEKNLDILGLKKKQKKTILLSGAGGVIIGLIIGLFVR